MAEVFAGKQTVVFVGGPRPGTQAGIANAGGCTVDWYESNIASSGDLTDLMGSDGEAKSADTSITYDHTGSGDGERKFAKAGIGTGVTAGMVAYASGTNITTGRYEVTSVAGDDSWVCCANIEATGDNADSVLNIGGHFKI